jgi:hypothetical protein
VNEAELQAVLYTLREHDFQDVFTKWQKCWERWINAGKGAALRGIVARILKVKSLIGWQQWFRKLWIAVVHNLSHVNVYLC